MKKIVTVVAALQIAFGASHPALGASFPEVWSAVEGGAYATKPEYHSTLLSFFSGFTNVLRKSANRTLDNDADILPPFQKLVHPIGICFSGTWSITEPNDYTGYFAQGANGLIIVRASEAIGNSDKGEYRAFGLAGKIFPTTNPSDQSTSATANFFTVDDLGGTKAASFLDLAKTNQPETTFHPTQLAVFPMLTKIATTFATTDAQPGERQVYEIAELGLANPSDAKWPRWISIVAATSVRTGHADFRDELRLANYPNGLTFAILVADEGDGEWRRLGAIHLTKEALSFGCDHRLHFHHPRWKS